MEKIEIRKISKEEVGLAQAFLFKMVKELFNTDKNPLYHHRCF